ncbi:MAG: hypothetical protein JWR17_2292 [Pseudomonas sp.]|uniref:Tc toxin subunit A-related protein n=1 Tax=Pseudomonas sp. TaxID=306 RepID=UPI0026086B8B|nr:neuraminidase-like domain-containing protein [Pseudomonas sp.]MDB6049546.1 hypothetical protein [Pseudomonas sp.]
MSQSIIGTLEQQRRDALVAYYLGNLVGLDNTPHRIATENDLYEYLLIDNQVTAQVDTSRVAQGIASVQQHIHAIYNGMEPGYTGVSDETLTLWREGMSQYSLWSGYQMLEDYPENYLDPTLRLDKTIPFKTFESELAQARLSADTVQSALGNYLQAFETISNLQITGCYINSSNFINADYYFIGRQSIEPFAFYWRKARLYQGASANKAYMAGWTEWKAIESITGAHIKYCRPVVMDGRLYAVWVESSKAVLDANGAKTGRFEYRMKLAFRRLDESWSVPILLFEGETNDEALASTVGADGVISKGYRLAVSTDHGHGGKSRLLVGFRSVGHPPEVNDLVVRDDLLNPLQISDAENVQNALQYLLGTDNRRVQFCSDQLLGGEGLSWRIKSVVPDLTGPATTISNSELSVNDSLELRAEWQNGTLALQGFCSKPVGLPVRKAFYYHKDINYTVNSGIEFSVSATENSMFFRVLKRAPSEDHLIPFTYSLFHTGSVAEATPECFVHVRDEKYFSYWVAVINIDLDPNFFRLEGYAGGFFVKINSRDNIFLDGPNNYVQPGYVTAEMEWGIAHYERQWLARYNTVLLNGAAKTPVIYHGWPATDDNQRTFQWGEYVENPKGFGLNGFIVTREPMTDPAPHIATTESGAQYLALDKIGIEASSASIRLNTLFAKELTHKASLSLGSALSWETQHTEEPPLPGQTAPVYVDFIGANGLYFWELFFHASHLVAWRLQQEFDYSGAQNWLHRLFNPQVRVAPLYPPPSDTDWRPYWTCRPLGMADNFALELEGLTNPDAIARGAPSHYRKAIFMLYLNNLIAWGDMLYRQVTRDTLNEAKLHYVRALSLLGPLSKGRSISHWTPVTLEQAGEEGGQGFAAVESSNVQALKELTPVAMGEAPWLRLLDTSVFRLPVNSQLLDLWDRLDLRLHNLRHNLTLDGKPLQLALYDPPANPLDLLRAQLNGSSLSQRRLGSLAIIPPYRFRAMLPRAQNAVDTLIRFSQQVLGHMELRDRAQQEELQQNHVLDDLVTFAEQLQQDAIDQASKGREVLQANRQAVSARKQYYDELIHSDVSQQEKTAHTERTAAMASMGTARVLTAAGHIATMVPNQFGLTSGGMNWGGALFAAAEGLEASAAVLNELAQQQLTHDMQNRRRAEWQHMAKQAELELDIVDRQIEAQNVELRAATTSLEQAIKAREQAAALYAFIKNRATGAGLYQWLLSQMSTLYFQAYDAVLALCLGVEACWQYEIGDRDTRFISTTAWADNRFGLTAGETLKLGLLQMESAFLARHEHRLELTKTVSLKGLLADYDPNGAQVAGTLATGWAAAIETLRTNGEIQFAFKSSAFDRDYPGHYLRQLTRVSVSLPVVLEPYQDIHATLSQQSSSYLLKPQIGNVKHLYQQAGELSEGNDDDIRQDQIVFNPRTNQQIGISTGVDDHGLFTLDFNDERYFPFEGTGAISSWTLSFPNHESDEQQAMLGSLTDVILHVRYLAVDGGKVFSDQVETLVAALESTESVKQRPLLLPPADNA